MKHTPVYIAMCYAIGSYRRAHPRNDISWDTYLRAGGAATHIGRRIGNPQ